jgi:hypothetical protein
MDDYRGVRFEAATRTQRIRDLVSTLSLEEEGAAPRRRERFLDVTLPDTLVPWGKRTIQRLSATGHTPRRTLGRLAPVGGGGGGGPHPPASSAQRRAKPRRAKHRPPSEAPLDKAKSDWACPNCGYQYNAVHSRVCVACATSSAPLDPPAQSGAAARTADAEFQLPVVERLLAQLEHDSEKTCQETVELLRALLQDVVRQPKNLRFRTLRLVNPRMASLLRNGPGAAAATSILEQLGFVRSREPPEGRPGAQPEEALRLPIRPGDAIRCGQVVKLFGDWLQQRQRKAEAMFSAIDSDGDGSLTMEEMKSKLVELGFNSEQAEAFFYRIDADGDGNATHAEFVAALAKMSSEQEEVQRFTKKLSSGSLQKKVTGEGGVDTWEAYSSELSPLALSLRPERGNEIFLEVLDIDIVCAATNDEDAHGLPRERVFVVAQRSDGTKHYLAAASAEDCRAWIHELAVVRMPTLINNSQCGFSARWLIDWLQSEQYAKRMAELRAIKPAGIKIIRGPDKVAADDPHDFEEGTWATYVQLLNGRCVWANSPATKNEKPPSTRDLIDTWLLGAPAPELPYISQTRCLWEMLVDPVLFGPGEARVPITSARSYAEHVFNNDRVAVSSGALGQVNLFVSQSLQSDAAAMVDAIEAHCKQQNLDARDVFCWLDGLSTIFDPQLDAESYQRVFNKLIEECGHTLAVMHPGGLWHESSWMKRVWCIHEVYHSLQVGAKVSMGLTAQQLGPIQQSLVENPQNQADLLSCVDVRKAKAFNPAHKQMLLDLIKKEGHAGGGDGAVSVNVCTKDYMSTWMLSIAKMMMDGVESRHHIDIDGDGDVGVTDEGVDLGADLLRQEEVDDAQNEADCRLLMSYVDLLLELKGPCEEARNVCIQAIRMASGMEVCTAPLSNTQAELCPTGELMELKKYTAQQVLVKKLIAYQEFSDGTDLDALLEESGRMVVDAHWRAPPAAGGVSSQDASSSGGEQSATTAKAVVLAVLDGGKQLRVLFANAVMQTVPVDWVLSDDWTVDKMLSDYTGEYNRDTATGLLPEGHAVVLELRDRLPATGEMSSENIVTLRRQVADTWMRVHGPENEGTIAARAALAASLDGTDTAEARALFDELIPLMLRKLGPKHFLTLKTEQSYGQLLSMTVGDHEAARPLLEDVVAGYKKTATSSLGGNTNHTLILNAREALAETLEQLNSTLEARMEREAVIRGHVEMRGPDHPKTLGAKCKLVMLKHRQLGVESRPDQFVDSIALMRECANSANLSSSMGAEHPQTKEYETILQRWMRMKELVAAGEIRYNPQSPWVKVMREDKGKKSKHWAAQASELSDGDASGTGVNSDGQVQRQDEPAEGVKDVVHD